MFDSTGVLAPTNSVVQQDTAVHPFTTSRTNSSAAPAVVDAVRRVGLLRHLAAEPGVRRRHPGDRGGAAEPAGRLPPASCPGSPACNLGSGEPGRRQRPGDGLRRPGPTGPGWLRRRRRRVRRPDGASAGAVRPVLLHRRATPTRRESTGTADDADIYRWDGTAYSRAIDARRRAVQLSRCGRTWTVSPASTPRTSTCRSPAPPLPGLGAVADEDVVYFDNGTWTRWFDGTRQRLAGGIDLDTISVVGNTLYFTTDDTQVPPGCGRDGRRRRHLPVERRAGTPSPEWSTRARRPRLPNRPRPAPTPTWTAWSTSTPPTSTCPTATPHNVPGWPR